MMMKKRLYKDHSDKKLCGVCSGIAKYFDIDPTVVRLALVLFCLLGGSGILAYIICAIVMPDEPGYIEED
jgi:phage shock protein PspC (stress-responsive transcriptional regulator)